jgi:hypothetical protein
VGTRADFYVAHTPTDLEWLGSIAYDGDHIDNVGLAEDQLDFRKRILSLFSPRDDVTLPEQGFPWPWRDSRLTDHAYVWVDGIGVVRRFGDEYPPLGEYIEDDGRCDTYISVKREAELHSEANREDDAIYHPLWSPETGFHEAARVDAFYKYPDMVDNRNVRLDRGSGAMFISG